MTLNKREKKQNGGCESAVVDRVKDREKMSSYTGIFVCLVVLISDEDVFHDALLTVYYCSGAVLQKRPILK